MSIRKLQLTPSPNKQKLEIKRSPLKSILSNKINIQAICKSKELYLNFNHIKRTPLVI